MGYAVYYRISTEPKGHSGDTLVFSFYPECSDLSIQYIYIYFNELHKINQELTSVERTDKN